ncbi:unnamed protein product [Lathyrus sativus]|nr:unnamed protein product [Lathyrus sativus]
MELESMKKFLEKGGETASMVNGFPPKFMETLIMSSLRVDLIEPGCIICSMTIPPRLLNSRNSLHGGGTATLVDAVGSVVIPASGHVGLTGVSVEINVTYFDAAYVDEEIEIEAKALRMGKNLTVTSVEFRKKKTGKVFAQGRHTKYLPVASKL